MSLLSKLPHKAEARTRKRTSDGMGGFVDSFDTIIFSNKDCWEQPATTNEVLRWKQKDVDITHNVYFSENPNLTNEHILIINGWRLDVKSVNDPDASAGLGVLWKVVTHKVVRFEGI